ncbi:MAG: CoA-binding protein [Actinobacteria bacterium]|nr:CoA-binding protein [Actinomycetota bacterium]
MTADSAAPGRYIVERALAAGRRALDEVEAKALFTAYGIPVVEGAPVRSAAEAVEVAGRLGYPVVMKGLSSEIQHKSEAGLVLLDIPDDTGVCSAFDALTRRAPVALEGVLVEQMISGGREFVIGMSRDPQFGPAVMFGLGGVLTEALQDVVFGVAPLDEREAGELLDEINSVRLLGEFRGAPPVDRDTLITTIRVVGRMALDHPEITEVDINPMLVDGCRPIAVDALVALGDPPVPPEPRLPLARKALDAVFYPDSVAVVGASNDVAKWGGVITINIISGGFPGPVYPINPHDRDVLGRAAYPSLSDLPAVPDLAIIAVPAVAVKGVVEECAQLGVKAVVIISGGFSEAGPEGVAMEREIAQIASDAGMAMIGPNCVGAMSSWRRFYGTGGVITQPGPGPASFLSHSGNMGVQLMASAEERHGGVGKFVGIGNEALATATDLLDYFCDDPQTGLILDYVEGLDDGRRFMDAARRAAVRKPFIVLRGGSSEYGAKAAASHTGAMAGSQRVFEAVVRQCGIIATDDPDEFIDLAFALSYLPLPRGRRVAVVTMGGGWGVVAADEVARSDLVLAELPEEALTEIDRVLPPYWSRANPVDLVGTMKDGAAEKALEVVVRSDAVDAVVVLGVIGMVTSPLRVIEEVKRVQKRSGLYVGGSLPDPERYRFREGDFIKWVSELMRAYQKPIINVSVRPIERAVFGEGGPYSTVVLPSPLRSVRVIAKMCRYQAFLERLGAGEANG